ncbi:hypothetical protein AJ79_00315 [Helicocarpus griseus UAMH5409]|uniref:Putative gamma-glutamylcyclotransferase n=1 Tax=Helicocarpus griseus UAMH5409 TaxID=1447875 RepID=A0A2B7YAI0_9EURO|nr:hypothetical protein AJ79_00315 [Helicocarpus griseus UAMH5409]
MSADHPPDNPSTDTRQPPTTSEPTFHIESSRGGPAPPIDPPWKPTYLFVYGSLMDPDVIQAVLALPQPPPPLRPAKLKNYRMKMWGIYPTLVPSNPKLKNNVESKSKTENGTVDGITGKLYLVEHPAQFTLLERYESQAYTWHRCVAQFTDDGSTTEQSGFECRTFVWAGEPESPELEEGRFDFERYQRYFKPKFFTGEID